MLRIALLSTALACAPIALAQDARPVAPDRRADTVGPALASLVAGPVDWLPWGREALERARREGRPVLLWSTYAGCSWCDRMERESFDDEELAAFLNARFVCVAVDRDALPVVDQTYLATLALVTGDGGWPITAFLDPQTRQAFFVGTYFPPEDEGERPAFRRVVETLAEKWADDREPLIQFARGLTAALPELLVPQPSEEGLARGLVERGVEGLLGAYDADHGGFGEGAKFLYPERLELLLESGDERAIAALRHTLHAILRGAVHDQLGGGFHRQALDPQWSLPEFAKPLTQQTRIASLLARVATSGEDTAPVETGPHASELAAAARAAADYVVERLTDASGRFLAGESGSSVDGVLGANVSWTREEVEAAVGADLAGVVAKAYRLGEPATWRDPRTGAPRWVLRRAAPLPGGLLPEALALDPRRLASARERLIRARDARPRPALDDTTIAGWSGLAAAGLAEVGVALDVPELVDAAVRGIEFVFDTLRDGDGRLRRSWRAGRLGPLAVAEDYVFLLRGLLALHAATEDDSWLERATALHAEGQELFGDAVGGWFDAAAADFPLVPVIGKSLRDGEVPAVNAELLVAQLALAERTGDEAFLGLAAQTLEVQAARLADDPSGAARALLGLLHFERAFPDRVPRGEGPVVRVRDAQVTYELRLDPDPPGTRTGGVSLRLTLTAAEGHQIAAEDPLVEGPVGLQLSATTRSEAGVSLTVPWVEPDYGRLTVAGAPLATHGEETTFHLWFPQPEGLSEGQLELTLQVWSDQGPTPPRTVSLDLSRFAP